MAANKKEFRLGLGMMVAFTVVLVAMFFPIYHGHNGLEYLDALYNSISKGSAYYIPKVQEEVAPLEGTAVELTFAMPTAERATQMARQLNAAGALVNGGATVCQCIAEGRQAATEIDGALRSPPPS